MTPLTVVALSAILSGAQYTPAVAMGATPVGGSRGVMLSFRLPSRTVVRDSLVRVEVRLENRSLSPVHVRLQCPYGPFVLTVQNGTGRVLFPPVLPGAPMLSCPTFPPGRGALTVAPGQSLRKTIFAIARAPRFTVTAYVTGSGRAGAVVRARTRVERLVQERPLPLTVVPDGAAIAMRVDRPAGVGGLLYYRYWLHCSDRTRESIQTGAGYRLMAAAGRIAIPSWATVYCGSGGRRILQAVVGLLGHRVGVVRYTMP